MLITIQYLQEQDQDKTNDTKNAKMAILCCHNYRPYIFTTAMSDAGHQQKPEKAKVGGGEKGQHDTKKRVTTISWIPFNKLPEMYKQIENQLSIVNLNHFGFDGVTLTEPAQFTEYPKGGFYDWHMDLNAFGQEGQNPIRNIFLLSFIWSRGPESH